MSERWDVMKCGRRFYAYRKFEHCRAVLGSGEHQDDDVGAALPVVYVQYDEESNEGESSADYAEYGFDDSEQVR